MLLKTFFGYRFRQRTSTGSISCFAFVARAKDVKQWAGVRRTHESKDGAQRILRLPRVRAITRFISSNAANVIPNSILLAFEPGVVDFQAISESPMGETREGIANGCEGQVEWGQITFQYKEGAPEHERPALIVDGQHRLFGMAAVKDEDLPVLLVALLDASVEEQAFQFIVINNKAVRVPTANVKAIIAGIDEDSLSARLLSSGVRYGETSPVLKEIDDLEDSPFRGLLVWPRSRGTDGQQLVPLTAIEQCLRFIGAKFTALAEDDDSMVSFYCSIWRAISAQFAELWGHDNVFMTKVNICALNEFVVGKVETFYVMDRIDIFDRSELEDFVKETVKRLPVEFWLRKWKVKVQDNANVRSSIVYDMERILSNTRAKASWYEGLKLIGEGDAS